MVLTCASAGGQIRPGITFWNVFLYQEEREELFRKLTGSLPNILSSTTKSQLETKLFGINIENLDSDPRNIPIIFAVQKYILKTKQCLHSADHPPPSPHSGPALLHNFPRLKS